MLAAKQAHASLRSSSAGGFPSSSANRSTAPVRAADSTASKAWATASLSSGASAFPRESTFGGTLLDVLGAESGGGLGVLGDEAGAWLEGLSDDAGTGLEILGAESGGGLGVRGAAAGTGLEVLGDETGAWLGLAAARFDTEL